MFVMKVVWLEFGLYEEQIIKITNHALQDEIKLESNDSIIN